MKTNLIAPSQFSDLNISQDGDVSKSYTTLSLHRQTDRHTHTHKDVLVNVVYRHTLQHTRAQRISLGYTCREFCFSLD